eukprot:4446400-Alexandrium_andersonii.AAC.1
MLPVDVLAMLKCRCREREALVAAHERGGCPHVGPWHIGPLGCPAHGWPVLPPQKLRPLGRPRMSMRAGSADKSGSPAPAWVERAGAQASPLARQSLVQWPSVQCFVALDNLQQVTEKPVLAWVEWAEL